MVVPWRPRRLPFVLGVLADLSGKPDEPLPPFEKRKFVEINRENFGVFMRRIAPRLAFRVDNTLADDDTLIPVELRFQCMEDFEPEGIVQQVEPLRRLLEIRKQLTTLGAQIEGHVELRERLLELLKNQELFQMAEMELGLSPDKDDETRQRQLDVDEEARSPLIISTVPGPRWQAPPYVDVQGSSLVNDIIVKSGIGRTEEQHHQLRQQIATLVKLMQGSTPEQKDLDGTIAARIAALDDVLSRQLNKILHTSELQRLEGTWRGLYQLVYQSKTSTVLKIRVCNVSKKELLIDLQDAQTLHKSIFFKKVYEEEYGTFGGTPYGAIIGDYEFERHPQDIALLEMISRVAAAAYVPFVAAASSQFFCLESFTELNRLHDLAKNFDSIEYVMWRRFRNSEDSRYVGLILPRLLMRLPYGPDLTSVEAFRFVEDVDGTDHSKYLWGNAVYAFGACLTAAFSKYHWCAALLGVETRGLVQGLPIHVYMTDDGEAELKCPVEITISDRQEEELSKLGFIPLVHCKGTSYAAFFSMQSCHRSKNGNKDAMNTDACLSTNLPYVLAVSRFVHYLKAIMRDKIGSFRNKKDCEDYLNRWVASYVLLDDNGSLQAQAENPLREARIEVNEVPGRVGIYRAEIFLRPRFQVDERTVAYHITAELSKEGREVQTEGGHGF